MKVSKCGGTATTLATAGTAFGSSGGGFGLALDATNAYWVDDPGDVLAVPLAGGKATTLASNASDVLGLTLAGGNLYWLTPSVVEALPIQGGAPSTVAMSASSSPNTPAADDTSIYWGGDGIFSVSRAGGTVTTLATTRQVSTGLAIDDANVYWCAFSEASTPILSTPKTGGPSVTLATGQVGATAFAADGLNVYWTINEGVGAVMKVPVSGGAPVTLASAPTPGPIVLDDTSVYWAQSNGPPASENATPSIMRLTPK
jgi:hypothetical protein